MDLGLLDKAVKLIVAKLINFVRDHLRISALLAGIFGGICGILPDIDHPIALFLGIEYPHFLHQIFFLIACSVFVCCCAYLGRLCVKVVLKW